MTDLLPALPDRRALRDVAQAEELERQLAAVLGEVEDVEVLEEWRAQAAALAEYLKGRELQGPMLGAQRRIEARIGQLLGATQTGERHDLSSRGKVPIERVADRHDFRLLARALNGDLRLTEEEWRQSRRALVSLVKERLPTPPRTSTASADVRARLKLRREFEAELRSAARSIVWLGRRAERTAPLATEGEVDRWLVRVDELADRLQAIQKTLYAQEVSRGG